MEDFENKMLEKLMLIIRKNKGNYMKNQHQVEKCDRIPKFAQELYLIIFWLPASPLYTQFIKEFGTFSGKQVTYHSLSANADNLVNNNEV